MNPRAIVASFPVLRRVWRVLPGPLKLPILLIGAIVGIWYLVTGRRKQAEEGAENGANANPGSRDDSADNRTTSAGRTG